MAPLLREDSWDLSIFSTIEKKRFHNLVSLEKRAQFITGRTLLRQKMGSLLELPHSQLDIAIDDNDKPYCNNSGAPFFNLSHSKAFVALALCRHDIGIDLESHRPRRDIEAIARSLFSQEENEQIAIQPDERSRRDVFYNYWVKKEALGKLTGRGILAEFVTPWSGENTSHHPVEVVTTSLDNNYWLGIAVRTDRQICVEIIRQIPQ